MATFCMMLMAITAQAQCFILGSDNKWQTNVASAELQATGTDGVYEGEVAFTNGAQYFTIVTKLTEAEDDWVGLLPYRYGPATNDNLLTVNMPMAFIRREMLRSRCPQQTTHTAFVSTSTTAR